MLSQHIINMLKLRIYQEYYEINKNFIEMKDIKMGELKAKKKTKTCIKRLRDQ